VYLYYYSFFFRFVLSHSFILLCPFVRVVRVSVCTLRYADSW